ncbi:MAG: type II toxin-antitoxin system HicA family toxin [Planctomycetota bacterium]
MRQRGSHLVMKQGNRLVTVPMHGGDIPIGTLKSILRQGSIDLPDLMNVLK